MAESDNSREIARQPSSSRMGYSCQLNFQNLDKLRSVDSCAWVGANKEVEKEVLYGTIKNRGDHALVDSGKGSRRVGEVLRRSTWLKALGAARQFGHVLLQCRRQSYLALPARADGG